MIEDIDLSINVDPYEDDEPAPRRLPRLTDEIERLRKQITDERMAWKAALNVVIENPHHLELIGSRSDNLVRIALGPVAGLVKENERLRAAAQSLITAMETCHICGGILSVDEGPVHCEDCSSDCENHEEAECASLYGLHLDLKRLLKRKALNTYPMEGMDRE